MRRYQLKLNDKDFSVRLCDLSADEATLEINGKEYNVAISSVSEIIPEGTVLNGTPNGSPAPVSSPVSAPRSGSGAEGSVLAPIPGIDRGCLRADR